MGLFHFARSYWQSAEHLRLQRLPVTHPAAPITFLFYHAIELYLKSYLRCAGLTVKDLKQYSHGVKKLGQAVEDRGLKLIEDDREVLNLMDEYDNVIRSRYITTGAHSRPEEEALGAICGRLDVSVGDALRASNIQVRRFEPSGPSPAVERPDDFETDIEEELVTLNKHERDIIAYLLDRNERLFTCAVDGGHAVTLISRKLLRWAVSPGQHLHLEDVPVEIPKPIWKVLQKHKDKFPCSRELREGPRPWRVHWMAR
jgi:hypothetical protein